MKYTEKILILLFSTIITSFFLLERIDEKLKPVITKYINLEVERTTSNIMNSAVNEITEKYIIDDLIEIKKNAKDEIQLITYNTKEVNELLKEINDEISNQLLLIEEGKIKDFDLSSDLKIGNLTEKKEGLVYEIPLGSIIGQSTLFAHIGPKIPIKMNFIGQINTNLKTKVKEYGINNIVVELYVQAEILTRATMPISTKNKKIKLESPLSIQIIQGQIPSYYFDSLEKTSQNIDKTIK